MNKTILLQILFCVIYIIIIIFISIKTITSGVNYSINIFYKIIYLIILIFPPVLYFYNNGITNININSNINSNIIKKIIYFLCFIGLIYSAIYLIGNLSFLVGWFSIVIGFFIIIIGLAMLNETIKNIKIGERKSNIGKDYIGWFAFLWKFIFYIPCLIIDFVNYIKNQFDITPNTIWFLFIFEIILILIYFYLPEFIEKIIIQDGKQIIKEPLYLNDKQEIGSISTIFPKIETPLNITPFSFAPDPYDVSMIMPGASTVISGSGIAIDRYGTQKDVSCSDVFMKSGAGYIEISGCNLEIYDPTYKKGIIDSELEYTEKVSNLAIQNVLRTYSISTWVFINPHNTSVNSYSFPTNILRIGPYNFETAIQRTQGKPMLSYFNYIDKENEKIIGTYRIFLSNTDEKYYDIIAPEQKWNFFVFNYSNKIDVFLNGDLVISAKDIAPPTFSNIDSFIVGEDEGLDGAIKNTVFFPHILTTQQIFNLKTKTIKDSTYQNAKSGGR